MIVEKRSLNISVIAHVAVLLIAVFGLPIILPDMPDPQPSILTVELLPITEMTNVRPSDKPIQKAQKAPTKTPVKKEPPKPQPAAPKPQPKTPEPVEEKHFDPNEGAEPKEEKKPKEQPKEEKKEDQKFEDLLKDLTNEAKDSDKKAKDTTTTEENKTVSSSPFDETIPLGMTEQDALNSAYIPCWSAPAGVKDAASLIVTIYAQYNPDGSLINSELDPKQKGRYGSDPVFRAAADAALRATRMPSCNPLKNLPSTLYPKLKNTKINFDPRLLG